MEISSTLNQALAVTAYNSQQPLATQSREQDSGVGSSQEAASTDSGQPPRAQVSFSSEALRLASDGLDPNVNRNSINQTSETTNEPRQSDASRTTEVLANSAKSVTEALSAYREASVI